MTITPSPAPDLPLSLRITRRILHFYITGLHAFTPLRPCSLPPTGPAILVCNHISGLDPLILQVCCPRLIVWMMAREYYDMPGFRPLFNLIHAIPVQRSGRDLAATRQAFRALDQGHILGIFPEGRIETTAQILPFQTGTALMALRANVPVYPACIDGTTRNTEMLDAFLYSQRGVVTFGPAVTFNASDASHHALTAATAAIRDAVLALRQSLPPI